MSFFDDIGNAFNKAVKQAQNVAAAAVKVTQDAGRPLGNVASAVVDPVTGAVGLPSVPTLSVVPTLATLTAPVQAAASAAAPVLATVANAPAAVTDAAAPVLATVTNAPGAVADAAAPAYAAINSPAGSQVLAVAAPEYAWLTPGGRQALLTDYGPAVTVAATAYGGPAAGAATGAAVTVANGGSVQDAAPALVTAAGAAAGADPTATAAAAAVASGSRQNAINAGLSAAGTEAGVDPIITNAATGLADGQPISTAVQDEINAAVAAQLAGLNLAALKPATSPVGLATQAAVAIGASGDLNAFEAAANAAADAVPIPDGEVSAINQGLPAGFSTGNAPAAAPQITAPPPALPTVEAAAAAPLPPAPSQPAAPTATAPAPDPSLAARTLINNASDMTLNQIDAWANSLAGHAELPVGTSAPPPIAGASGTATAPAGPAATPAPASATPAPVPGSSHLPMVLALVGLGVVAVLAFAKKG